MIYLKKVEMYGFKSFADKIELKFDQPITGIVGPNGCGKSNVSDAIRWVLGEQSTKNLRGKIMQDLIFSGTDTRKMMSYCEVSLFMDNTTRIFPIEMDEIIISRKLYRNNESEYSLNRNVVRLKDIVELLRAVGLGKESYAIVGQGRMDAILNARPDDRRAIFEEALGISGFRARKVETERKLERNKLNMDQHAIVLQELERQLPSLRRQSTIAKKYLDYRDRLRILEINAYIYGYDHASSDKEAGRKKLDGLNEECQVRTDDLEKVNAAYDRLLAQIATVDETLSALHEKNLQLAVLLEKQTGEKNLVAERITFTQTQIAETDKTIADLQGQITEMTEFIAGGNERSAKYEEERNALENETFAVMDRFNAATDTVQKVQRDMDAVRQKLTEILHVSSQLSATQASVWTENDALRQRLAAIEAQEKEISERIGTLSGEAAQLLRHYEECKKKKEEVSAQCEALTSSVKRQEFDILEYQRTLQHARQVVAAEEGSMKMLSDIVKNYTGFQSSVQNLMRDSQRDEELAAHLCDVTANCLKVEEKYRTAIEVALGSRLENVITDTLDDTRYLIRYLKDNGYGRVTFLPINSMKPHTVERREVLSEKGVLGIAKDLISFDRKYYNVFASLLGGTVVVDTYDNALALSRKYGFVHRMVTLAGERIFNDGSVEGGGRKNTKSYLAYESQIAEHEAKLQRLKEDERQAEGQLSERSAALDKDRQTLNALKTELQNVSILLATDQEKIETSNTLESSDKNNILNLTAEKERIEKRLAEIDKKGGQSQVRQEQLKENENALSAQLDALKEKLERKTAEKDAVQEDLTAKRYRIAVLKSNIESLNEDLAKRGEEKARLEYSLADKIKQKSDLTAVLEIAREQLANSDVDSGKQTELESIVGQIKSFDAEKARLNNEFKTVSEEKTRLSTELENLKGVIFNEEYILQKIDEDLEEMQKRVEEEYNLTYSAAMMYKQEDFDNVAAKNEIAELKTSILNLGGVNVNAIEDLKDVEARYNDISAQVEDLQKAEADLKKALNELETRIETEFVSGMEQINENFKVVFRELFNGGNAKLLLEHEEGKDPLDYGVEIEAQPPGKKLQNISLLSGGERTLTAAAILFAILKLRPMPFCILDEIEAALDDANAERIAKYMRNFSERTQFVVITHKKPTMENSDVLYGVTMEEKGVSKIVSVKLNEAVREAK